MVRVVLVIAVIAVAGVLVAKRAGDLRGSGSGAQPAVDTSGIPPQFRQLLADAPDARAILAERGALPGLGIIRRLVGGEDAADDAAPVQRPFADVGTRRQVRSVRRDIRRDLATLNRYVRHGRGSLARAARTLRAVYASATLAALGEAGRRAFAARLAQRDGRLIRVLDFDGVFVAGRRALAQVVYRLSVRDPSGRFSPRPPDRWTVTLTREEGRWRFVRGFDEP